MKLVLDEQGTAEMRAAWSEPVCVASALAYAEARAALAGAGRAGRLRGAAMNRSVARLGEVWDEVTAVTLDDALAGRAGDLAATLVLSGADAVHLATALAVAGDDLVFATWDGRLANAARAAGLRVFP